MYTCPLNFPGALNALMTDATKKTHNSPQLHHKPSTEALKLSDLFSIVTPQSGMSLQRVVR
ncbi:hypothetical protein XHV734_3159 [Xanthomonas hortorum pv. vitians]|nr:hypothetical protein XHV734_3159 [Xanthomonas hortorum pv. vitians]